MAAAIGYAALVAFLRISGKRTLARLNAFDLVVTVALGSTFASVVTSRSLPIADGVLALALLISLQFAVAWLSIRVPWFEWIVKSRPAAVFTRGEFARSMMVRERVSTDDILLAVRSAGLHDLDRVVMVIMETDGSLTVIGGSAEQQPSRPSTADVRKTPSGKENAMPSWTDKDERMYDHIKESAEERGKSEERAQEIAARTVNKQRREEGRTPNETSQGTGNPTTRLESRTRDELENRAAQLNIAGRSDMTKEELVEAIRQKE